MASDELSLFSYEILGLVGRGGAGPHDLRLMARRGRILDWAGESQYYAEPKRLARLGYLEARRAPGKTRERTVYALTEKAYEALRAYAETPARVTPFKSDGLLRLLIADLVGEERTRAGVAGLREDVADLRERLEETRRGIAALPHRETYLGIVNDFVAGLLDLYDELVERVEDETAGDGAAEAQAAR
ncbi:MAG TPA: hypothetical protein VM844_10855 [Miltoncostaeaceae bacterium]|nr:hypothetical protein [Miltoncostaeaceae bacterium]